MRRWMSSKQSFASDKAVLLSFISFCDCPRRRAERELSVHEGTRRALFLTVARSLVSHIDSTSKKKNQTMNDRPREETPLSFFYFFQDAG